MRILLIGGNGFIGSPLASELRDSGHSVAIFHRSADKSPDKNVVRIQGDRNRLSDHLEQIQRFSPEVIVDLILSSGEQARQLISTSRKVARRVIAISSMDVYRAWGVVHQSEPGPLEALPLTEDSPPRTNRQLYPPETVKMMQSIFSWVDEHYDKIAVEEAILNSTEISGTVLRLPMVYGPGDPLHRFFPLLKRFDDGRSSILLADDLAAWRGPRGYVENIAHAIALAATSNQAAGRVYNVCQEPTLSELAWQTKIATQAHWSGEFVVLSAAAGDGLETRREVLSNKEAGVLCQEKPSSFRQALVRRCVVFSNFGRTSPLDGSRMRGLHVSALSRRSCATFAH